MTIQPRSLRHAAVLMVVVTSSACAHGRAPTSQESADRVLVALNEVTSVDGDAICASERVQTDRAFQALQGNAASVVTRSDVYGRTPAPQANLSQLTAAMSQSFVDGSAATDATRAGVLGAARRAHEAQTNFDNLMTTVESRDMQAFGQGSPSIDGLAVQYAAVWSEYFGSVGNTEVENQVLDWLTTRSMANPDLLRLYQQDFDRALAERCS